MEIPESIKVMYEKLYELCTKYPVKIPLEEAAEFLEMGIEGLRSSIEQGRCQFGLCVQKNQFGGKRYFTINTLAFYSWVTNGAVFRVLDIQHSKPEQPRKYVSRA